MNVSRIVLLLIALLGLVIAWDEDSVIFTLVSFAWAGFGATFGPVMLFSLFWKRINRAGAIAGMLSGGISVFVWKNLLSPMGGVWGIYELFPAFIISCIFIVVVSLCTKEPIRKFRRNLISRQENKDNHSPKTPGRTRRCGVRSGVFLRDNSGRRLPHMCEQTLWGQRTASGMVPGIG